MVDWDSPEIDDGSRSFERAAVLKSGYVLDPAAAETIIDPTTVPILTSSAKFLGFDRVSERHGRSIIDPNHQIFRDQPTTDEFGNVYEAYSMKGMTGNIVYASPSELEPTGVRIEGLFDYRLSSRCIAASKVMRANEIMCEWPMMTARPKNYPEDDVNLSLRRLHDAIYFNSLLLKGAQIGRPPTADSQITPAQAYQLGSAIGEFKPGIMYRAMLSNARLADLKEFTEEERQEHMSSALRAVQNRDLSSRLIGEDIRDLDPDDPEDVRQYQNIYLPVLTAENIGRMAKMGLAHRYLHAGNISLAGEIVDLDSVVGKSLEAAGLGREEEVTDAQFHNDFTLGLVSLLDTYPNDTPDDKKFTSNLYITAYRWAVGEEVFDRVTRYGEQILAA